MICNTYLADIIARLDIWWKRGTKFEHRLNSNRHTKLDLQSSNYGHGSPLRKS